MSLARHVESLQTRHSNLELLIKDELSRPLPDAHILNQLKQKKLRIKEELFRLTKL
jgi:hypothetical protein